MAAVSPYSLPLAPGLSVPGLPATALPPGLPSTLQPPGQENSFAHYLLNSIGQVNQMQQQADRAVEALFTGGNVNPAEVLTAVQKADLAFRLLMEVRNKFVQAFDEVRAIQV